MKIADLPEGLIAQNLADIVMSPQSIAAIDDHALNVRRHNAQVANKLLGDKRKRVLDELAPGVTLYELPQKYFVIDERSSPPRVIYYVKYEIQNLGLIGKRAASQVLVWRSPGYAETRQLPARVFWQELLPKTGTIVTDYQQTNDGRRFWTDRIGDALQTNLFVYYVNLLPPQVIKEIKSLDDLETLGPDIYGGHQKYRQRRVIIIDHELQIENS